MDDLSPRQREILEFITAAIDTTGVVPSYREIGAALGIGSTNGVSDHLKALQKKGYLERGGNRGSPRALRVTEKATTHFDDASSLSVPIIGRIAAGQPLLATENYEGALRMDAALLPMGGQVFALVVTGDSMIDDGIHDGDVVLVERRSTATDGATVVAVVRGEATVKRLARKRGRIHLIPANAQMKPIVAKPEDVEIRGVVVALLRRYR